MNIRGKRWAYELARLAFKTYLKVNYNVFVEGLQNIEKNRTYVIASRHINPLDPPIIQTFFPFRVDTLAKADLFRSWWRELFLKLVYAYPIIKDNKKALLDFIEKSSEMLASGSNISLYPEGQVTIDGSLLEFKSGLGKISFKAQQKTTNPIYFLPTSICYSPHHHIKGSDLFITFGKTINLKEYFEYNNEKDFLKLARKEIGNLTKVTCSSLVAQVLLQTEKIHLDNLVDEMSKKYEYHKEKNRNVDERMKDKNFIKEKILDLCKKVSEITHLPDNSIVADTSYIPGYCSQREEIINEEKKKFDTRTITIYNYRDGCAAFLCKRGYQFRLTNLNVVKVNDKYELIIEKCRGKKENKYSFIFETFEEAQKEFEKYIMKEYLLEDQINIIKFMANQISHLE